MSNHRSACYALLFSILVAWAVQFSLQIDKYVHMDLKGAPPRPAYFKQLLDIFASLGAKGVVIEWEDMFPLTGILAAASNGNAYSRREVLDILEHAAALNLTVIPLVQTFGHLEWLLKTSLFAPLRENQTFPMVMCIGSEGGVAVLGDLLSQVATLHSAIPMPFVHIGADEAYMVGVCEEDRERMAALGFNDTKQLVLAHFQAMAQVIHKEFPDTKVLAWHDEFASADPSLINEFDLSDSIIPVVWKYWPTRLDEALPPPLWRNLSESFPGVWIASAFKGANGADEVNNKITPYVYNNQEWFKMRRKHEKSFNSSISSVIITGWQRYDHFAVLCELLPSSLTSLGLTVGAVERGVVDDTDAASVSRALSCPKGTSLLSLLSGNDSCGYPGHDARLVINEIVKFFAEYDRNSFVKNRERGWFGRSNRLRLFSEAYYVDDLSAYYHKALKRMDEIEGNLRTTLSAYFFPDVAEELIVDHFDDFRDKLNVALQRISSIDQRRSFPVRPIF